MLPNHPPPLPLLESASADDASFFVSGIALFDGLALVADAAANGFDAPVEEESFGIALDAKSAAMALEASSIKASPERCSS